MTEAERDPEVLAAFRDIRCHSSVEVIKAALVGNDRDEHIFALTQSLELYDVYQGKIWDCDRKLEAAVAALTVKVDGDIPALPKARTKRKQANAPSFDVRAALYGVLGTDLTRIHGLEGENKKAVGFMCSFEDWSVKTPAEAAASVFPSVSRSGSEAHAQTGRAPRRFVSRVYHEGR